MDNATTAEMEAHHVLKYVERWGPRLTGMALDRRKCSVQHFQTTAGGMLRSLGRGGSAESWTFDWILLDDIIVEPSDIRNPNIRDQVYRDIQTKFFSRITPTGTTKFVLIGSRRHPADPQGRLLEDDENTKASEYERWHYHMRQALIDADTDHERALWPTSKEFTVEGLRLIRQQKIVSNDEWIWHCSYQNDAIASPDLCLFNPAWFVPDTRIYYNALDPSISIAHKVLAFDPSMGPGEDGNDCFAIVYELFTADGTIYVDDCWVQRASPDVAVEAAVEMIVRHQDMEIAPFEANAGGRYIEKCIKEHLAVRSRLDGQEYRFPSVLKNWTSGDNKLDTSDKPGRISLALWEKLSKGKFRINRHCHSGQVLFRQLRGFPTERLDGPDACATGDIVLRQLLGERRRK